MQKKRYLGNKQIVKTEMGASVVQLDNRLISNTKLQCINSLTFIQAP